VFTINVFGSGRGNSGRFVATGSGTAKVFVADEKAFAEVA
jgi:hypothetical protein